jgi:uncharacterized protein YxjI
MTALLEADTLVVSQKAKLIELTNQYEIHDVDGAALGYLEQEGQSGMRKAMRFLSTIDQFLTHRLSVYDADHVKVLELTRPAKLVKSRVTVEDGQGRKVGAIVQQNVFGKIRFDLVGAQDERMGQIRAENWRAWDFSIVDRDETEVARIDKKFVGVLKAVFTTADNYVVHLEPGLSGDLRLLVIAAAAAVDTALKQDPRGIDITDAVDFI